MQGFCKSRSKEHSADRHGETESRLYCAVQNFFFGLSIEENMNRVNVSKTILP